MEKVHLTPPQRHMIMSGQIDFMNKNLMEEEIFKNQEFILINESFVSETKLAMFRTRRRLFKWRNEHKHIINAKKGEEIDSLKRNTIEQQISLNEEFLRVSNFKIVESKMNIKSARKRIHGWRLELKKLNPSKKRNRYTKSFSPLKNWLDFPVILQKRRVELVKSSGHILILIEKNLQNKDLVLEHNFDRMVLKSNTREDIQCCCCLETLNELLKLKNSLFTTKCSHSICQKCLVNLIQSKSREQTDVKCPLCRCFLLKWPLNISLNYSL
jgi:hypothetical protein